MKAYILLEKSGMQIQASAEQHIFNTWPTTNNVGKLKSILK